MTLFSVGLIIGLIIGCYKHILVSWISSLDWTWLVDNYTETKNSTKHQDENKH